jgi:hypothetical protein
MIPAAKKEHRPAGRAEAKGALSAGENGHQPADDMSLAALLLDILGLGPGERRHLHQDT